MKLEAIELVRFRLPLKRPFRTSYGTDTERDVLLVHVISPDAEGWGECVAEPTPSYSSEFVDASELVIQRFIAPLLFGAESLTGALVGPTLARVKGYRMAKAAVEAAVLDMQTRAVQLSLACYLGGVRSDVLVGVSVGIQDSLGELLDLVESYVSAGYQRIKLKIEPGWDLDVVRAVRDRFGSELLLQVDANTAYCRSDIRHLTCLDEYELLLIEQPFPAEDLEAHAALASRSTTPVCLDESIESAADALRALKAGACSVINIKPGRVGGLLEARRIHDVCAAWSVPVWCGGMLETGVGRAGNLALASLPNFLLPNDISATDRYYEEDITKAFDLVGSSIAVPQGPGIGVEVNEESLQKVHATRVVVRRG